MSDLFAEMNRNSGGIGLPQHVLHERVAEDAVDEDTVMEATLDGGGDDVELEDGHWIVTCERESYDSCKKALLALGVELVSGELTRIPENTIEIGDEDGEKLTRLLSALEDLDDVQETYTNAG